MRNSFQYVVDYDYDVRYSCRESGCNDEGICRCSEIYNERITNIDLISLTEHFYQNLIDVSSKSGKRNQKLNQIFFNDKDIDKYFINRILTINKLYNKDIWEIDFGPSYYGDEINDIFMRSQLFDKVIEECEMVIWFDSLSDKVKYILELEYGKVLDSLKNSDFKIDEIFKEEIDFENSNQKHLELINKKDLSYYEDFPYICGIVKKVENKYKIIDGHHRLSKNKNEIIKVIITNK